MARPDDFLGDEAFPGEDAHLMLEGIDTPIHTRITRRSARGMTVEQPLPFLQLRTLVRDQNQRRARIESVSMLVCDGLPRLVLDLAYEPDESPTAEPASPDEALQAAAPSRMVRPRHDDTCSFELPTLPAPAPIALRDETPDPGRERTLSFDTLPPPPGEPRVAEDVSIDEMVEKMHADQLGPRLARGWAFAKPHLRHAVVLVVAFVVQVGKSAYPHGRRAAAWMMLVGGRAARAIWNARPQRSRPSE